MDAGLGMGGLGLEMGLAEEVMAGLSDAGALAEVDHLSPGLIALMPPPPETESSVAADDMGTWTTGHEDPTSAATGYLSPPLSTVGSPDRSVLRDVDIHPRTPTKVGRGLAPPRMPVSARELQPASVSDDDESDDLGFDARGDSTDSDTIRQLQLELKIREKVHADTVRELIQANQQAAQSSETCLRNAELLIACRDMMVDLPSIGASLRSAPGAADGALAHCARYIEPLILTVVGHYAAVMETLQKEEPGVFEYFNTRPPTEALNEFKKMMCEIIRQTMLTCRTVQNGASKVESAKEYDSVTEYVKVMCETARGCILEDTRKRKKKAPGINLVAASSSGKRRRVVKQAPKQGGKV